MTRQYWSNHARHENLITEDRHVACLIINSFQRPEMRTEDHLPYIMWKNWLRDNPLKKPRDK